MLKRLNALNKRSADLKLPVSLLWLRLRSEASLNISLISKKPLLLLLTDMLQLNFCKM